MYLSFCLQASAGRVAICGHGIMLVLGRRGKVCSQAAPSGKLLSSGCLPLVRNAVVPYVANGVLFHSQHSFKHGAFFKNY